MIHQYLTPRRSYRNPHLPSVLKNYVSNDGHQINKFVIYLYVLVYACWWALRAPVSVQECLDDLSSHPLHIVVNEQVDKGWMTKSTYFLML